MGRPTGRKGRVLPRSGRGRAAGVVATGLVVGLVTGGRAGPVVGLVVAVAAHRLWPGIATARHRRRRASVSSDLPFLLELLAACLRTGATTEAALRAVTTAMDGPVTEPFRDVLAALRAGVDPREAWARLADLPGGTRLAAAAGRSAESGAALAAAFTRVADGLRESRSVEVETAARRVAVLNVLPLGLCFLPAFLLAGIVPVVLSVLGGLATGPS